MQKCYIKKEVNLLNSKKVLTKVKCSWKYGT